MVDDEEGIRKITGTMLVKSDYRVLTASDGAEAVGVYVQHLPQIAVLLTDLTMQFMDGVAMTRALQKIDPKVKIVVSTGVWAGRSNGGRTAQGTGRLQGGRV